MRNQHEMKGIWGHVNTQEPAAISSISPIVAILPRPNCPASVYFVQAIKGYQY